MPPLVIAAGIGAAASIGGSLISGSATSKASRAATDAAAANNALARETYAKNEGYLSPAITSGNAAGGYINNLLGIGGDPAAAKAAFDTYRNSTGYKFQLDQGLGAVNSNAYAKGMGQSGATYKALQDRGNNIASTSFGGYLGDLSRVADRGTTAASSLAGVGTNMVGQVSANNNNAADAVGNAALVNASNINGTINNLINAGAYAYGSSYGKKTPTTPVPGSAYIGALNPTGFG